MHCTKLRKAFTLVELLVVIAIIGILIGMLLPAVQSVREAARRIDCGNKMRQHALGFHNYESANMHLPAGMVSRPLMVDADAKTNSYGWGVVILPQIEQQTVYDPLSAISDNLSMPEFVDGTIDYRETILDVFICPSCPMDEINPERGISGVRAGKSNYVAVWGTEDLGSGIGSGGNIRESEAVMGTVTNGITSLNSRTSFGSITDGTSNTFLIGERDGAQISQSITALRKAANWIGANEAIFLNSTMGVAGTGNFALNAVTGNRRAQFGALASTHTGGANFAFGDASTHFVSDSVDDTIYQGYGTRSGQEVGSIDF